MQYIWLIWIVVAIVCFFIEAVTVNLVTIWLGISAIITALVSGFVDSMLAQVSFFVILTGFLLFFTRPVVLKYIKPKETNAPSLIGKECIVNLKIDNIMGTGQVKLNGNTWNARAYDKDAIIDENSIVIIREIRGVTLLVERKVG